MAEFGQEIYLFVAHMQRRLWLPRNTIFLVVSLLIAGIWVFLGNIVPVSAVVTPPTAPSAITTSTITTTGMTVGWTDNSSGDEQETGFLVDKSTDGSSWTNVSTTVADATSYAVTGLTANTGYWFRVAATNASGTSAYVTTTGATYTKATDPTALTTTASTTAAISLQWTGVSSTIYQIYGSGITTSTVTASGTTVTTTTSGLTANTSYSISVRSVNQDGTYNTGATTTDYTAASVPTPTAVTVVSATQLTFTWSGDATTYYAENSTASTNSGWISGTSYAVSGLACNTAYTFKVRGKNANNTQTDWSATVTGTTNTCGGGGGSSSSGSSSTNTTVPVNTVTPTPLTVPAVTPEPTVTVEPSSAVAPVVEPVAVVEIKPVSKVLISNVPAVSLNPGQKLSFSYEYKNDGASTAKVKVLRQMLDGAGTIVASSQAATSLKPNAVFKRSISETINKKMAAGNYTERIRILDAKTGAVLEENSFALKIELPVPQPFTFTKMIKSGVRGTDVSKLQETLKRLGFFTYPQITGLFGQVTRTAVQAYQKSHNLVEDGTLNVETRNALNAELL